MCCGSVRPVMPAQVLAISGIATKRPLTLPGRQAFPARRWLSKPILWLQRSARNTPFVLNNILR